MSRQYYGIEDLGLTAAQRNTLVQALRALGRNNNHSNPSRHNHWRVRNDSLAIIFEGDYHDDDWTIEAIKNRLATIFGIDPATITHNDVGSPYGRVVTFARSGNKLRMVAFGGLLASWEQSHEAALAYLAANAAAWEQAV